MELGLHRVWHGLKFIPKSIRLVIAHPVLLVYGISSFVISSLVSFLLIFSGIMTSHVIHIESMGAMVVSVLILLVVLTCISLFFLACLAHHAMHILQNEPHSIKETLHGVVRRLPQLCLWFCFKIALALLLATPLINIPLGVIIIASSFIFVVIINYVTSLVLPILATEQTGVIAAIKRSYRLTGEFFMIFIGLFLVFNIFGSLIFVEQLGILTYTIFYYEYYARPKPELAELFYPDV